MMLIQLFLSFFQIGLFSFGGGYATLPLLQDQVVMIHHWLTQAELNDLITISQMTPGPIAINAATFVGSKISGFSGAVVATLGCILPSCIIVTLLAYIYVKYRHLNAIKIVLRTLRPVVIALIATASVSILVSCLFPNHTFQWIPMMLFMLSFYLLQHKKMNPITVMVIAGVLNVLLSLNKL